MPARTEVARQDGRPGTGSRPGEASSPAASFRTGSARGASARVAGSRRTTTVRGKILRTVILLTALTLFAVGATAVWLERGRVIDAVDATLLRTTREMSVLLQDGEAITAEDGISDAIWAVIASEIPAENEGTLGFVGTHPRWKQPGGLEMDEDPELIAALVTAVGEGRGTISTVITAQSTYRYALLPVSLGPGLPEEPAVAGAESATGADGVPDGSAGPLMDAAGRPTTGAIVIAFDLDAELMPVWASARTYLAVSLVSMLVVGLVAWLVSGRLLAPLRELRETAELISDTDLSRRIEVNGSDDVADLTRTVNDMLGRLEASFRSQRQLLDDAGHELRTPITIVRGHLELMDPADADDARQTRELAISELDRMHRLADDLVLLAKADGPMFVQTRPTDLGPLLDNALDQVRQLGDRRFVVDARLEAEAHVDGQRLTQALIQLAANAVKFSSPGTTVALGVAEDGEHLLLWVRDEGRGIAPEDQARIFERFARSHAPGEERTEGAGLGLAIVSAIARAHGGRVDVDSTPGVGSTFVLELPAVGLALDDDIDADAPDGAGPAAVSGQPAPGAGSI